MPEATHVASGKVREIYALDDDRLLLVASDRISTFDVVLPTEIPDKGRVLTGLSGFWFSLLHAIVPNHMLAIRDDARSMECRRLDMLPIECVVRGYVAGSAWKDYKATGATSGHTLPEGLRESDKLAVPIFTPATKAQFWPADAYEPGRAQDSFDKQFVRDYCEQTGWDKTDPGPELPDDVVMHTRSKYIEAFEQLTTIPFEAYLERPAVVLG
jgi:phosphoribosylaminoimidazole-succinocarboxamide synthase